MAMHLYNPDPEAAGLNESAVAELFAAVSNEAARGPVCGSQIAIGRRGVLGAFASFGRAPFVDGHNAVTNRTLFSGFSVTKALTSSAVWLLLEDGSLSLADRVADRIPAFAREGMSDVTVEHLLTHTAGFPNAPFDTLDWNNPQKRRERFQNWTTEWAPGSRFTYHGTSSMWVLAELIECVSEQDFRAFIRNRVIEPLGLHDIYLGLPKDEYSRVAHVVPIGEAADPSADSPSPVDAPVLSDEMYEAANRFEIQEVGSPGGGVMTSAAALALFYQGILGDWRGPAESGVWQSHTLEDAFTVRFPDYLDPMTKQPALRGLGVVTAGEEGGFWRGFSPHCSVRSIGHMGAGGQIAWADPESGLSFVYLTNGAERDAVRQGGRGLQLSILATACAE